MANFFPFLILAFPIILSFTHGEKNNEIRNIDEVPSGGRVTPMHTVHIFDGLTSSAPLSSLSGLNSVIIIVVEIWEQATNSQNCS